MTAPRHLIKGHSRLTYVPVDIHPMHRHRRLILFCALLLTSPPLTGCQSESPETTATTSTAQLPTEVSFGYIHHLAPPDDHDGTEHAVPREVTLQGGAQIRLEALVLVTSAVELHRCAPTNELSRSIFEILLPQAHAHVPSSATRQGTPYVEDLLSPPGAARMVGGIAPPPGDYCELHVILTPADDDAINLTSVLPEEIEDHTAMARGSWRSAPDEPWREFEWTTDLRRVAVLPLEHPQSGEAPLQLATTDTDVLLLVDKQFPPHLPELIALDGQQNLDFEPFFQTVIDSLSIYRFP